MPATRFFALLDAGRKLKNVERIAFLADLCDVASIPLGNAEYFKTVRKHIVSRISLIAPELAPPKSFVPVVDSNSVELRNSIFAMIRGGRLV